MKTKQNIFFALALSFLFLFALSPAAGAFDMNEGDMKTITLSPEKPTKMTYWNKDMWKTSRLTYKIFFRGKVVATDTLYVSASDGDEIAFNAGHDKIHIKCEKGEMTVFVSQ